MRGGRPQGPSGPYPTVTGTTLPERWPTCPHTVVRAPGPGSSIPYPFLAPRQTDAAGQQTATADSSLAAFPASVPAPRSFETSSVTSFLVPFPAVDLPLPTLCRVGGCGKVWLTILIVSSSQMATACPVLSCSTTPVGPSPDPTPTLAAKGRMRGSAPAHNFPPRSRGPPSRPAPSHR